MPVIRRYNSDVNVVQGGAISVRRATGDDFGAFGGRQLEQLGSHITKFANDMEKRKNKRDAIAVQRALIEADVQFQEEYAQSKLDAPFGAEGFAKETTDRLNALYADVAGRFNESGLSEKNAYSLDIGLLRMRQRAMTDAVSFESASTASKLQFEVKESFDTLQNSVQLDPSRYNEQREQALALIAAAGQNGLTALQIAKLTEEVEEKLAISRFDGLLARATTPEQVIAIGKDLEQYADKLPPNALNQVQREIRSSQKALIKKREIAARKAAAAATARVAIGDLNNAIVRQFTKNVDLVAKGNEKDAETFRKAFTFARRQGEAIALMYSLDNEERNAMAAKLLERAGKSSKDATAYDRFIQARLNFDDVVRKNPVDFAERFNPRVRAAVDRLNANPNDPAAYSNYIQEMQVEQLRVGIPIERQKLLSPLQVKSYAALFSDNNRADDADDISSLQNMATLWGPAWPTVASQLIKEDALTGHDITTVTMTMPEQLIAAVKLKRAALLKNEDFKARFPPDVSMRDISNAVRAASAALASTLPVGNTRFTQFSKSMETLAAIYVAEGATPEVAGQQAYNEILGIKYNIGSVNDTNFRIPKQFEQQGLDGAFVSKRLQGALKKGEIFDNLYVNPNSIPQGMTETDMRNQLKARLPRQVIFKTTPEETGLHVIGVDGNALLEKDPKTGAIKPLVISWTQVHSFDTPAEVRGSNREQRERERLESRVRTARNLDRLRGGN